MFQKKKMTETGSYVNQNEVSNLVGFLFTEFATFGFKIDLI
jgi:hypothetical protein